jgi:hypothetical protein
MRRRLCDRACADDYASVGTDRDEHGRLDSIMGIHASLQLFSVPWIGRYSLGYHSWDEASQGTARVQIICLLTPGLDEAMGAEY